MNATKKKSPNTTWTAMITSSFLETKEVLQRWAQNIVETRPDLYPKMGGLMFTTPDENSFTLTLLLGNELGRFNISIDMKYVDGNTVLNFRSYAMTEKSEKEKYLLQIDLISLGNKYEPVVNSFRDLIAEIQENQE
ncbi:MAG: hypothetical protein NTY74_13925 [Ignavibacteriae bacterium]|nr:hypothetical protein [Ignavibacteriota bacterium]